MKNIMILTALLVSGQAMAKKELVEIMKPREGAKPRDCFNVDAKADLFDPNDPANAGKPKTGYIEGSNTLPYYLVQGQGKELRPVGTNAEGEILYNVHRSIGKFERNVFEDEPRYDTPMTYDEIEQKSIQGLGRAKCRTADIVVHKKNAFQRCVPRYLKTKVKEVDSEGNIKFLATEFTCQLKTFCRMSEKRAAEYYAAEDEDRDFTNFPSSCRRLKKLVEENDRAIAEGEG